MMISEVQDGEHIQIVMPISFLNIVSFFDEPSLTYVALFVTQFNTSL